jgi:hypothetical protein
MENSLAGVTVSTPLALGDFPPLLCQTSVKCTRKVLGLHFDLEEIDVSALG